MRGDRKRSFGADKTEFLAELVHLLVNAPKVTNSPDITVWAFSYFRASRAPPIAIGGRGGLRSIFTSRLAQFYYLIYRTVYHQMSKKLSDFSASENLTLYPVRAKYYVGSDGIPRLASVQKFSRPVFRPSGWELSTNNDKGISELLNTIEIDAETSDCAEKTSDYANIQRATRRAKIMAFDYIMCNPDLNLWGTFTYSPDSVSDKADYDGCYELLRVWLSNRVQRRDLKYVIVPEHTKAGDIHFHAIMNDTACELGRARSAKSGRALTRNGKPLYNITDWKHGFTSAEIIACSDGDRRAVAKYIFKYMGKQMGQKIGGRYVLTGGDLKKPFYVYGEDESEFLDLSSSVYERSVVLEDCGVNYKEWGFI